MLSLLKKKLYRPFRNVIPFLNCVESMWKNRVFVHEKASQGVVFIVELSIPFQDIKILPSFCIGFAGAGNTSGQ